MSDCKCKTFDHIILLLLTSILAWVHNPNLRVGHVGSEESPNICQVYTGPHLELSAKTMRDIQYF